jgi:hypothetical protein
MPINAFSTYRPVTIFLVTLALADVLYRYQAVKNYNRNYLKIHDSAGFFIALSSIMR